MTSFLHRSQEIGAKSALEEGVVDNVAFAIVAFDEPVTGADGDALPNR
jgi:hypothetical protein